MGINENIRLVVRLVVLEIRIVISEGSREIGESFCCLRRVLKVGCIILRIVIFKLGYDMFKNEF